MIFCQISRADICLNVSQKQENILCHKDNHCFWSTQQTDNCFTPLISFIPPKSKEEGAIFISILQRRERKVKRLSMVIKLELGRGTFQHSPSTESELSVLGSPVFPSTINTGCGLPAEASLFLLPSSVSKISKVSSRKLLSGQVLEPERMGRMGLTGQEIRKQHQQKKKKTQQTKQHHYNSEGL